MLVLSRLRGEECLLFVPGIEKPIVVMLVEQRGDKVRLGFEAPDNVTILRREVYESMRSHREEPVAAG